MYEQLIEALRLAYDAGAEERDSRERGGWKIRERAAFLTLLQQEEKLDLLEIGAGPGWDSLFYQQQGLQVVATDLSPQMVRLCREKGLQAHVMDFKSLDFPAASFDAVYALNCLLHVPKRDLGDVLTGIERLLKPAGLFFLAVYGGLDSEGTWLEDHHRPQRFFSFFSDERLLTAIQPIFDIVAFKAIPLLEDRAGMHVQRLFLRKRQPEHTTEALPDT